MDAKDVMRLLTENQMEKLCEPGTLTDKTFAIMMGSICPWYALKRAIQYDNLLRGAKKMRDLFKSERKRADEAEKLCIMVVDLAQSYCDRFRQSTVGEYDVLTKIERDAVKLMRERQK